MQFPERAPMATARATLEQRRTQLVAEIEAQEVGRREQADITVDGVNDQKDLSQRQETCDLDDAEERRDLEELRQVEAAIGRIDSGLYGRCVDCDESIDALRLQVQPAALRCVACQASMEHAAAR
jgi:DnaK suppressor protein